MAPDHYAIQAMLSAPPRERPPNADKLGNYGWVPANFDRLAIKLTSAENRRLIDHHLHRRAAQLGGLAGRSIRARYAAEVE